MQDSTIIFTRSTIKDTWKRYGLEGDADTLMQDANEIAKMPYVVLNPDKIEYDPEYYIRHGYTDRDGTRSKVLHLTKEMDGVYHVFIAVTDTKYKRMYVIRGYKEKRFGNAPMYGPTSNVQEK